MRRKLIAAGLMLAVLASALPADDFNSPEWKSEIAHGYLPYRKLTYDDFPVANGVPTPHWMHTEGFFHYSYKTRWSERDGVITAKVTEIVIRSGFDQNKSWKQGTITETKALLEHEQGHLDINELHASEFRKATMPEGIGSTGIEAMEDLKVKIRAVCDKWDQESKAEQAKYDNDTNHGAIQAQQEAWTAALKKRLEENRISYWDAPR
ncbi:MAG: DUF922 domain-containing protein [Fimbriimonadales bacterium]